MEIVFKLQQPEIISDDFGFMQWRATLIVENEFKKMSFVGEDPAKTEALRLAFQSFLDDTDPSTNSGYSYEYKSPSYSPVPSVVTKITIDGFDKEYHELIWQLIDAKFGMDKYVKITNPPPTPAQ